MKIFMVMRSVILLVAIATSPLASAAFAKASCRAIEPTGHHPFTAESYVLPLSLRINLILLLKRELHGIGLYDASTEEAVFTTLLESSLRAIQRERGEPETGCITWQIITAYDSRHRTPPAEGQP